MTAASRTQSFVGQVWDRSITPTLVDYIKIPNKSPAFDPQWQEHGHMDRAVALFVGWCREKDLEGLTVVVVRLEGRTPLIYMEIPGDRDDDCVVLYGHLDKQPEMSGWRKGLGPWQPVIEGDKLYGRGGADDGYAAFASLTAIRALRERGGKHARCVVLIEGCEESGSYDLPAYIEHLADRIGSPSLVVCLDSGCGNYEQLWCTTSLRGIAAGTLRVRILTEGVHSGDASGIVPSSFRILRTILSRLEDESTGKILPEEFWVDVPQERVRQAAAAGAVLGADVASKFPFVQGAKPMTADVKEAILNRTWRPFLAVTGVDGIPALENAGNVLRPTTALKLSLRLPPTLDGEHATEVLKKVLTRDPPYRAEVTFDAEHAAGGWNAPEMAPWLGEAIGAASKAYFGKDAVYMGEGGTIPFMGMLGERFPKAQFMITGVLGPQSNAHGPNEFLHLPTGKRLTCCVADVLEHHFRTGPHGR
jgi:acetylornithine deacetylase/succinyl-diaminopimelate desuccinylase-like protein